MFFSLSELSKSLEKRINLSTDAYMWTELNLIGRRLCIDSGWQLQCSLSRPLNPHVGSQSSLAEGQ